MSAEQQLLRAPLQPGQLASRAAASCLTPTRFAAGYAWRATHMTSRRRDPDGRGPAGSARVRGAPLPNR